MSTRIEAGFVQVNQCAAPRSNVSYGGMKMSGLGKEYALDSMLNHFYQFKNGADQSRHAGLRRSDTMQNLENKA